MRTCYGRLALAAALVAVPGVRAEVRPPRAPAELAAYSERLPDTYEVLWPTGARTPLYTDADLAHLTRRIPRAELEGSILPQAELAVRLLQRALRDPRAAAKLVPEPLAAGVAALPALAAPRARWTVDFSLRSGDLAREWIPYAVDLPGTGELATAARALVPHLKAFQTAWAPPAAFLYPRTIGLADERLVKGLFEDRGEEPSDRPEFRTWRFTALDGQVLLDGPSFDARRDAAARDALRTRLAQHPESVIAREIPPATRIGDDTVALRVAVEGGSDPVAIPRPRSFLASGREVPTEIVPGGYPEWMPAFRAPAATRAWACRIAGRLDPQRYMQAIGQLDGEEPADATGVRFVDHTERLPGNQLAAVADYLERYYRRLGFAPRRQACTFEGRRYDNVIVDIPGRTGEWVLLADHYDAAVAGETFDRWVKGEGEIRPAPGADDNLTATATLMEAGRLLAPIARGSGMGVPLPLARGLRLVHLVGEEFPADCLGARTYVKEALARGERIAGLVLMDMIGYAGPGGALRDPVFQLNLGEHPDSARLTGAALQAFAALRAQNLVPRALKPELRRRFDRSSYLYNTDGVIFSDAGYPALLFNEHINKYYNLERSGYHDRTDGRANINRAYATGIARVAIATALLVAAAP